MPKRKSGTGFLLLQMKEYDAQISPRTHLVSIAASSEAFASATAQRNG